MTMSATTAWVLTVASAGQVAFTVPFRFFMISDLEVYQNGVLTTAFSVTGVGAPSGGTLTFYSPPGLGVLVFIRRVTAREQLLDLIAHDRFGAESVEAALDRLTAEVQDFLEELSRRPALTTTIGSAYRGLVFPSAVARGLIGWNANATALTTFPSSIVQVTVDPVTGIAYGKNSMIYTPVGGESVLGTGLGLMLAGTRCLGNTLRVLTTFGNSLGLTGMSLGGLGLEDGWGNGISRLTTTVTNEGYFNRGDEPPVRNASDVLLTAEGGTFDGTGSAMVTNHWRTLTPD